MGVRGREGGGAEVSATLQARWTAAGAAGAVGAAGSGGVRYGSGRERRRAGGRGVGELRGGGRGWR